MKKLLSLVLVLAVVLSSMSFAFAAVPTDVKGTDYEGAVSKLGALGILTGYPDGSFKPANTITRAEFAAVIVRALGYEDAAKGSIAEPKFVDSKGHWASGYINVASTLGIINGVGNGKFDPDSNVTFEQSVTMIVRALGYEPAAKSKGGYPVGYLTIASEKKITKDVKGVAGEAANRGIVAQLLDKSLEVGYLEQTSFGSQTEWKESATKNIYTTGLKMEKKDGTVASVDVAKKTMEVNITTDPKKKFTVHENIDIANLKNCEIEFYKKDDVIYSIDNKTTVYVDQLSKVNGSDDTNLANASGVSFPNGISKAKLKNADVEIDTRSTYATEFKGFAPAKPGDLVNKYAKVYVRDNKIFRYEVYGFDIKGITSEVTASTIKYQKYDANDMKVNYIDGATDLLLVFVDGKQVPYSELKADMYFEAWQSTNSKELIIAASSKKETGKLNGYKTSGSKVKIGDKEIDTTPTDGGANKYVSNNNGTKFDKNSLVDLVTKDVVAYYDLGGKIAFVKGTTTSTTTDFIGVLKKAWTADANYLKILKDVDGVGTEVTLKMKADSDLDTGSQTYAQAATFAVETATGANLVNALAGSSVFKFHVNSDNVITKIETITWTGGTQTINGGNSKFDKDNDSITTAAANTYYVSGSKFYNLSKWTTTTDSVAGGGNGDGQKQTGEYAAADAKLLKWADIEGKGTNALITMRFGAVGGVTKNAPDVAIFVSGYDQVDSTDKFYAYVNTQYREGDYYTLTVDTNAERNVKIKVHKDDIGSSAEKAIIQYVKDGTVDSLTKAKIKAVATGVYTSASGLITLAVPQQNADTNIAVVQDNVDGRVYDVDGSNVQLDVGGTWYNATSDCIVIKIGGDKFDEYKVYDISSISDIKDNGTGDAVGLVRDSATGPVRAIYYFKK